MSAMIGNPLLLPTEGYEISRSVRLRSSASAYLSRTPASAGNRRTFTISMWVKRGLLDANERSLVSANNRDPSFQNGFWVNWSPTGQLRLYGDAITVLTTPVYRDPSAWYHVVVAIDTTQATAANRVKFYVNGVEVTAFATANYPSQNYDFHWNNTTFHEINRWAYNQGTYGDQYLTEINSIDGQALTPSSFGATNTVTGVWAPKKYAGTYGTNGFYLNFSDNSSNTATTIGKDYSGNGNNWTPNNISVTSGSTYDSMLDVPTLWADGGNGRGNYCTFNPAIRPYTVTSVEAITAGNLQVSNTGSGVTGSAWGTFNVTSGKWYYEATVLAAGGAIWVGVSNNANAASLGTYSASLPSNGYTYKKDGNKCNNSTTGTSYGATYTTNDVIGVALDADSSTIEFFKNGTSQGVAYTGISSTGGYSPAVSVDPGTTTVAANFGQRPFAYTPPTGFKALNTQNLPEQTIKKGNAYFDATLYTGTGSAQSIVNSGAMQPDFVWTKSRSASNDHILMDSVRGLSAALFSNLTNAEVTDSTRITSLNANGFTLGTSASTNQNAVTFVGWQWNAGGSTVTNTSGSISAQVRANATAGFSVVTWTGKVSYPDTIGHGLGVVPSMIIIKNRNYAPGINWAVYHISLGNTKALYLNSTAAPTTDVGFWNNTNPTSTVFTTGNGVGYATGGNTNTYVAYCLAPVAGYSAFGSYTGNGSSDGPFVFCGFRPRWVMIKRTDAINDWVIYDTARATYNAALQLLYPNLSNAEVASGTDIDVISNGFKIRNANNYCNASGGTLIFAAFAENPFKLSLAR